MFLNNFKAAGTTTGFLFVCTLGLFLSLSALRIVSARAGEAGLEPQVKLLKVEMEQPNSSPGVIKQYNIFTSLLNDCGTKRSVENTALFALTAPAASLCISGASLSASDPTFNRPATATAGSGFGPFPPGTCTLSTQTAVRYDTYAFNVTGCAVFPTVVTATLCGPAGCAPPNNLDTTLFIYRRVTAGDRLTTNGGLPAAFNPNAPCTNASAAQDDLATGTATTTGGSSCNQLNTSDCLTACTGTTALSGLKRSIGSGQFTVVVAGFGNTTLGNYNLYVDAPGAGCAVTQTSPTAASVNISGRILTSEGRGLQNARITLTDSNGTTRTATPTSLGYYRFADVSAGQTVTVSIVSKKYTFAPQIINVTEEINDLNFTAQP